MKSISGVVLADIDNDDRDDEPLVGVIVELRDHHGNVTATTTTDYTGAFTFKDVVPGKYTVVEKNPTGCTGVTASTIPVNVFASTVISHYSGDKVGLCSTKNWGVEFVSSSFDPSVNETSFVYQVRNTGGNVTSNWMDISGVTIGWQGRCCVKDASYFGNFITDANPDVSGVSGLSFDSSWQEWERSTGTALDRSSGEVYSITYSGHHDVVPGVEDSDPRVTNDDDESGLWTEVVSKKKKTDVSVKKEPNVFLITNLGGQQSGKRMNKLTLFTKSN